MMKKPHNPVDGISMGRKPHVLDWNTEIYQSENYIVLDFETTNRDKGSFRDPENRIVLACWALGPGHSQIGAGKRRSHFGSEYDQAELLGAVRTADFLVAHHAKFECGWLARCGVELRDLIIWDTMLAEYVLAGNRSLPGGISLDETLQRRRMATRKMQYVSSLIKSGVCPSSMEPSDLEPYCEVDVVGAWDLFLRQRREIFKAGLSGALYGRCAVTPMLADAETRGVQLDNENVRASYKDTNAAYTGSAQRLGQAYGAINWRSPKQVRELLYSESGLGFAEVKDHRGKPIRTDTGLPSTGEEIIGRLRSRTEKQAEFLRLYKPLVEIKQEQQILESMLGCVNEDEGRLYAQFNQAVTKNHRLSSTGGKWGLQFQNFPRHLKKLFRARSEGWVVVEGDCPQLEFRVAADMAACPFAREDILSRVDVHALTSSVTGFSRQDSKAHTFKPLYGGNSGPPRLVAYYEAFRQRYAGIYKCQMGWVYEVLRNKQLRIPSGLVFYWPDTELTRSGYITNTPSIFNYPVSSFATADISQLSLCLVWHAIRGMDSYISNTVHDSGIMESPLEELDKVKETMVRCFTIEIYDVLRRLFNWDFELPLGVGIKAGERWGEGAEEKNESRLFTFN